MHPELSVISMSLPSGTYESLKNPPSSLTTGGYPLEELIFYAHGIKMILLFVQMFLYSDDVYTQRLIIMYICKEQ